MHILIEPNMTGRDFVVGDLHGHMALLEKELAREGFNTGKDRLFSVGDLVDRGPNSLACLKLLDEPWFYAVRGNHEQMMIEWALGESFRHWQTEFGGWTQALDITEIAGWTERLNQLPISMTVRGPDYAVGICHAEPCGYDWAEMIRNDGCSHQMMWGRKILKGGADPRPVAGIDITLHGHTPVPQMRRIGNRYFVDTGAGMGDRLTVQNIASLVSDYRAFEALA